MNPEPSHPMRRLLLQGSVAFLGALALYALGAGPASYYEMRYANTDGMQGSASVLRKLRIVYQPLQASVKGTSLQTPLVSYRHWWTQRAAERYPPPGLDDYYESLRRGIGY